MEDKWIDKCNKCTFSYIDMETCDYKCRCTNGCHYTPYKSSEKNKHIKDSTELSGGAYW